MSEQNQKEYMNNQISTYGILVVEVPFAQEAPKSSQLQVMALLDLVEEVQVAQRVQAAKFLEVDRKTVGAELHKDLLAAGAWEVA
jgi:hypothetical protein